jgi:hypothetical protein
MGKVTYGESGRAQQDGNGADEIQRWLRDVQRVASSGRSLIPQDRREAEDVDRNGGHD